MEMNVRKEIVDAGTAGLRTYSKPLVKESLALLPLGLKSYDVEEFKATLISKLPQNSEVTRKRYARYIINRYCPDGQIDLELCAFLDHFQGQTPAREALLLSFLRAEPLFLRVTRDLLWSRRRQELTREELLHFLGSIIAGKNLSEQAKSALQALQSFGRARMVKRTLYKVERYEPALPEFLYVLHSLFPEPGMQKATDFFSHLMVEGMLWEPSTLKPLLYEALNEGYLAKVSEIDQSRFFHFSTKLTRRELIERLTGRSFKRPDRPTIIAPPVCVRARTGRQQELFPETKEGAIETKINFPDLSDYARRFEEAHPKADEKYQDLVHSTSALRDFPLADLSSTNLKPIFSALSVAMAIRNYKVRVPVPTNVEELFRLIWKVAHLENLPGRGQRLQSAARQLFGGLISLQGFDVSVVSFIFHFLWPDHFPMMDTYTGRAAKALVREHANLFPGDLNLPSGTPSSKTAKETKISQYSDFKRAVDRIIELQKALRGIPENSPLQEGVSDYRYLDKCLTAMTEEGGK